MIAAGTRLGRGPAVDLVAEARIEYGSRSKSAQRSRGRDSKGGRASDPADCDVLRNGWPGAEDRSSVGRQRGGDLVAHSAREPGKVDPGRRARRGDAHDRLAVPDASGSTPEVPHS